MKPALPGGTGGRAALAVLAGWAAVKALGMLLLADALATAIAELAAGGGADTRRLLVLGVAGALLRAGGAWATAHAATRAGLGAKERLRAELVTDALAGNGPTSPADACGLGHGALSALASRGLDGLDNYYSKYLPALVAAAVIPPVLGVRILAADWVSALIVALTVPLVPIFMVLIGLHTRDRMHQAAVGLDALANQLLELAQGLPALIGLRRADGKGSALRRVSEDYRASTMGTLRTAFLSGLALELVATISVAVVAVFIGLRLVYGDMALGAGLLALILAPDCFAPLRELGSAHHASEDGVKALERSRAVLDAPRGVRTPAVAPAPGTVLDVGHLTVTHAGNATPTVTGWSLRLEPGAAAVLDGPSGTGKTTILRVLAGIADADGADAPRVSGRLGIDRGSIAWVPQHPVFSEETVDAELALHAGVGSTPATRAVVLERVNAGALGGRRPTDCSPGELRRVAVARALLRIETAPDVVLLLADEPTAHLDPVSADAVRAALSGLRGSVGILVASHDRELARQLAAAPAGGPRGSIMTADTSQTGTSASAGTVREPVAAPDVKPASPSRAPSRPRRSLAHWALLRTLPWGKGGLGLGILFAVLALAAGAALTGISGWLIVSASHQPHVLHLMVAIVGVRAFGLGRSLLRYVERLRVHDAVLWWAGALRERTWDALAARPEHWGRITRSGAALGHLVAEIDEVRDTVPRVLVAPAAGVLTWAAIGLAVGLWAPDALWVALSVGVGAWVLLPAAVLAVERRATIEAARHRIWLGHRVPALFAAARDLRANGVASAAAESFASHDAGATLAMRRTAWGAGIGQAGAALLSSAAAVLAVAGTAGGAGEAAAVGGLLMLALAEPITDASAAVQRIPQLDDGLRRLHNNLGGMAAERALRPPAPHTAEPDNRLSIRLRGVSAGWGAGPDVVVGADLAVGPGQWVAVTGPSGAGKSTLLAVLLGALEPRSGRLEARTGGGAWRGAALADLGRIAWCPQEGHLFDSTVRRNLCLGRDLDDQPTDAELADAVRAVGLGDWLAGTPRGLETRIGPGGHRLSGGQRQRLAVARALVARADVLLLDEPTAHLGEDEAGELVADLRAGLPEKAVVLVTHDARLEATADDVLRLGPPHAAGHR